MENKGYFLRRFSGTREEIGQALGCFYRKHGLAWFRPTGDLRRIEGEQIAYALRQLELVESYNPGLVKELNGLAKGLGVAFEQAAAVALTSGMRGPNSGLGCTAFVARSRSGDIYLARNLDFSLMDGRTVYLARFTSPSDACTTFGGTEALLGYTEGINQYGVAIAMAMVPMGEYDWKTLLPKEPPRRGVSFPVAIRTALETCDSAHSAAGFLASIPHLEPFNFLIADPSGEVIIVEAAPWGCEVRRGTPEEKMIITNVFSTPSMEEGGKWIDEMQARAQKTLSALRERALRTAWEFAERSLTGFDETAILALLRMVAFDYGSADATHTIWSACFNLTKRTILWCRGTPRKHRFESLGIVTCPQGTDNGA